MCEHNNKKMLERLRFETLGNDIDIASTNPETSHKTVSTKRYFASIHFKDDNGQYKKAGCNCSNEPTKTKNSKTS